MTCWLWVVGTIGLVFSALWWLGGVPMSVKSRWGAIACSLVTSEFLFRLSPLFSSFWQVDFVSVHVFIYFFLLVPHSVCCMFVEEGTDWNGTKYEPLPFIFFFEREHKYKYSCEYKYLFTLNATTVTCFRTSSGKSDGALLTEKAA